MMAYLTVNPAVIEKAKEFLKSVSTGTTGSLGSAARLATINQAQPPP